MKLPSKHLRPNWLPRIENEAVFRMIEAGGYRAYGVGGCVRDILLQGGARDVDIATDATPQEVMRLAEGAGLRVVPTGIEHGTVTVVSNGIGHEVTTFRRDVATDGRRAVVAYTTRIEEDAARRDFTMNALYATLDGEVIDPLGGLPDLMARRVRFVGDAAARIAEDRLRILRFFRFTATHGNPALGIDAEGLAACAAGAEGVEHLSRERVGQEMMRLLHADDPAPVVAAMAAAGVLARVLPGADATALPALVHLEQTYDILPDGCRRLAVMGGEDAAGRLRLSKDEAGSLAKLREGAQSGLTLRALGFRYRHQARDVALVRAALTGESLPKGWRLAIDRGTRHHTAPVVARDLMPGLSGAALGARLRELEDRWLASDLRLTKAELLG
ncbi:MAG: CCA tRNA nucleotidyltransferase [Gemmobacter sp.]